jgi:DNA repair protein RecO (recombination protein O)
MHGRLYSTEAIVLAHKPTHEADLRVTVFTKNKGKLTLTAKGARRPKSRKRSALELFNHIKIGVVSAHGPDIVTEATAIYTFDTLKKNLTKLSVAYFFSEVIIKLTRDEEPHEELFDLLLQYLKLLENSSDTKTLRAEFIEEVLVYLGFWAEGTPLGDPDRALESVAERQFTSIRVGKKVLG